MSDSEEDRAPTKNAKKKKATKEDSGGEEEEEVVKKTRKKSRYVDASDHPSYKDMVIEAMVDLGDNSNYNDIYKHISTYYTLGNTQKFIRVNLAKTINKLLDTGKLELIDAPKRTSTKTQVFGTFKLNESAKFDKSSKIKPEAPTRDMPERAARNRPVRPVQPLFSPIKKRRSSVPEAPPSDDSENDADYDPKRRLKKIDKAGNIKK